MTDKQIIINGIDVSGCDFLLKEDDYCSYSGEYRGYKGQCSCSDEEMCKDHPNCFYKKTLKQLKAKEQECQRLINKNNRLEEELNAIKLLLEGKNNQYAAKEQENEALKNRSDEWMSKYEQEVKPREFINERLNQLKAENKELRKCYKNNSALLDFKETNNTKLVNKIIKLEQTLAEIKELVKNMNKECFYDDFDCKDCDMQNGCTYQGKIKILQLISEVEDDRQD